ncbi:hypothetical protein [Maribellus sediminis]|uniref:hypothetical protein n=1 Tax=Maribellus sediminis TaxID=2696285 RepID=UPI00142F7E0A|nr:hypothetical protein [Maribellus sediminis]
MADVHNRATPARMLQSGGRSYTMSRMKGKNAKPEIAEQYMPGSFGLVLNIFAVI